MSALNTPISVIATAAFDVYVKEVAGDNLPEGAEVNAASSGDAGWRFAEDLRCQQVELGAWPKSGSASFEVVPINGKVAPFELGLFAYHVDDQLRVVMTPPTVGNTLAPQAEDGQGVVLFEGTIQRSGFAVTGDSDRGGRERETVTLLAIDAPSMDNQRAEHLIVGRTVADGRDSPVPVLIDGPGVPCVFNLGGRPNCRPEDEFSADGGALGSLSCQLFSADGDPAAEYWTVKKALAFLIAVHLFGLETSNNGDATGALPRSVTLEAETYTQLFSDTSQLADTSGGRWQGLDAILPEVDVQGLGVYDAIDRVCRIAGFRMAPVLSLGRGDRDTDADRWYALSLWRHGAGRENELRLRNRLAAATPVSGEEELADNNVSRCSGLRDAAGIINTVYACGRTLVETTVELKPMWYEGDVTVLTDSESAERGPSQREIDQPRGQAGDLYHQKHVAQGSQFNQYAHVGRAWGIDETGAFADADLGYSQAPYAHDAEGFDWLDHMGIDGNDGLSAARTSNGVTTPVRSTRRLRQPMRLTRPDSVARGESYLLEVSEDGGSNWHTLPADAYQIARGGYFGIFIRAENLATVNSTTFGSNAKNGARPAPGDSWWAKLADEDLRFRLTCVVELDSAARFDAPIEPDSQTRFDRALRLDTGLVEVWQSPSSALGDGSWARLDDRGLVASTAGADRTDNLKAAAEEARLTLSQLRWSIAAEHWLMDPTLFMVGDTITGVAGRDVDFTQFSAGSGLTRSPTVVGVTITGYPENAQGISIDVGDAAARRGV